MIGAAVGPVADAHVELLELPDAHDVVLVLVEHGEHAVGLLVAEVELGLEHRQRLVSLESTHVVLDVPVEYLLHFLPAVAHVHSQDIRR